MDQSAEQVTPTQPARDRSASLLRNHRRHGWNVTKAPVRTALVVMLDVASQDASEVLAANDQQVVEALPAGRPNPTLSDGIGVGRLHRCADDLGAGRAPHIVERPGELCVPVTDQELERGGLVAKDGDQVAGLLGHPQAGGMVGDAGQVDPPAAKLDEAEDIHPPQEDRVDGEAGRTR
jgi:hypothetical protein